MKLPLNNCKVTSPFGIERTINGKKSIHKGIDFVSTSGDIEVKAISDGVIRGNFIDNGFGNYVSIEHADGKRALYCHLKEFKKRQGDMVKAGDVIGIEGTTGNSTGVHLHLEVREYPYLSHNYIDVAKYLDIQNVYGKVEIRELTKEEEIEIIQNKIGIDDNTIKYLQFYKYGNELIKKIAEAVR